jgi:chromosome segregation ATPase
MEIVDISDLDNFIENYDYNREGEQDYHKVYCGGNFTSLNEFSLAHMSQQILARALIKQNQLINGTDEKYETEINSFASQFQKISDFYNQYPLPVLQREMTRQLLGEKDLVREFQAKLLELEKLCNPNTDFNNESPTNFEQIKEAIIKLQNITHQQKERLTNYQKLVNEKEIARQSSDQQRTETLSELTNFRKHSQKLQEQLTTITNQEQNSQQRISELEKNGVLGTKELKEELKKLIAEKQDLIQKLQDLQAENKDLQLEIADTSFNYKK